MRLGLPSISSTAGGVWRSLSTRAVIKLLIAVHFTFGTVGVIGALASPGTPAGTPLGALAGWLFAGLTSAGWVLAFLRNMRLLFLVIPIQVAGIVLMGPTVAALTRGPHNVETPQLHGQLFLGACVVSLLTGFSFFIDFIIREGMRHLRLRTEVALAEVTHRRVVPPLALDTPRFEAVGRSDASSEVGGDLVDAVRVADRQVFYVADVCGHGIAAGTLMSLTKGAARARLLTGASAADLLRDLNRVLLELGVPRSFVTLAGISFDETTQAEVFLAGHLPILHCRSRTGEIERLLNEHVPLGILENQPFGTRQVEFEPDDLFVLLSDGLTEVVDERDQELGLEGVERVLRENADAPLAALHDRIMTVVRRHGPQLDDQTLLIVRARRADP